MDWEAHKLNDREYYIKSPVARHTEEKGDLFKESFLSRTINRKLRMRDTFTNILPTYNHEPKTCYIPSFAHYKHAHFVYDMEGKPFV